MWLSAFYLVSIAALVGAILKCWGEANEVERKERALNAVNE